MNKHTTTSGPTGLAGLRSLLSFRHRNPLARLLSVLTAAAIALLLVAGTGPAYADDGDPAVTETTVADPAPDAGTAEPADPPADVADAPADDSADAPAGDEPAAGDSADSGAAADTSADSGADAKSAAKADSGPMATTLKTLAQPDVTPLLVGNADCQDLPNVMVGGFEIDGDPCDDEGGIDFNGGPGDSVDDGYGDDGNWFTQGSSENDDPATWTMTGNANTGKADIGTAWAWSHTFDSDGDPDDGHVFAYFGFTNDSTAGGTQDYSLEYNQAEPVGGKPVRTVGDLLFHFFSNGSNELEYVASYIYTDDGDSTWDDATCIESGTLGAGWCPFALPAGAFTSATSPTGEYVEGAIDITEMFGEGNCSGTFGTTFLRSAPGSFWTSELKDYVAPLDVTTPSTCGTLTIEKTDANTDAAVGGAVFQIDGDPRPGANPDDQLCIYDGPASDLAQLTTDNPELLDTDVCDELIADGTADGTIDVGEVEPGTYTVTELVAPPGYLLNPDTNSETVTVDEGENETVTFANYLQWGPLDISKTAAGTHGARYLWAINKQIAPTASGPWSDGTTPGAPLVKNVGAGGNTNLYYRVVVTEEGVETSAYVVSGTIHVDNPNDAAVTATITESLTGCTLDSDDSAFPLVDVSVPAGGADYAYTCDLGDGPVDPGTNTATITWDRSTYPQTADDIGADGNFTDSGDAGFTFEETASIDKTITVTDDHHVFVPPWVITFGDDPDGTYESAVYSTTATVAAGTCSAVITNTATITGDDDQTLDDDSESGRVCVPAVVLPPEPPEVIPPSLPNTGGPDAMILAAGVVLLLGGSGLVIGDRRRRRRS